jgi:lipoprotein-anchoring transpeptidase ErfK/SrfK
MESPVITVDVERQVLTLDQGDRALRSYTISTSRYGLGSEPGSFRTPLGLHQIAEKHGGGLPLGAVLKGRRWTGSIWMPGDPYQDSEDLVLTRILWLDGMETANESSRSRYIYIHGTNQEHALGSPASHGCVRMRNRDVAELYDLVSAGTLVRVAVARLAQPQSAPRLRGTAVA